MLLGEYGGGTAGFGFNGKPNSTTQITLQGYMVQASYFLTPEQLTRRVNVVRPLHNFGFKNGTSGLGAVEVHGRFSELGLGKPLFAAGFADPNPWSSRASAIDVGMNWHFNYLDQDRLRPAACLPRQPGHDRVERPLHEHDGPLLVEFPGLLPIPIVGNPEKSRPALAEKFRSLGIAPSRRFLRRKVRNRGKIPRFRPFSRSNRSGQNRTVVLPAL